MEEAQTLVSSLEEEKLFLLESGLKNVKPQTASVLLSRHVEEGRAERIRESEMELERMLRPYLKSGFY